MRNYARLCLWVVVSLGCVYGVKAIPTLTLVNGSGQTAVLFVTESAYPGSFTFLTQFPAGSSATHSWSSPPNTATAWGINNSILVSHGYSYTTITYAQIMALGPTQFGSHLYNTGDPTGYTETMTWNGAAWGLNETIVNRGTGFAKYTWTMTDSCMNTYSGEGDLLPGSGLPISIAVPTGCTPGNIVVTKVEYNSDGGVIGGGTMTIPPTDPAWENSALPPTPTTGTAPAVVVPQDTTSKTTPSISFNTGAVSAKDETLQTGFSSIRTTLAEGSSTAHADAQQIKAALAPLSATIDTGALDTEAQSQGLGQSSAIRASIR